MPRRKQVHAVSCGHPGCSNAIISNDVLNGSVFQLCPGQHSNMCSGYIYNMCNDMWHRCSHVDVVVLNAN